MEPLITIGRQSGKRAGRAFIIHMLDDAESHIEPACGGATTQILLLLNTGCSI
jgi:hypothetical protein